MKIERHHTAATALASLCCASWIFLGSNGIMLGGVGGLLGLLGLCCRQRCRGCHAALASVVVGGAAALHFTGFVLGITAIQFYLARPGKDWGPSIFGKTATHGAWWWIGLSILFCICNLLAAVIDGWLVYRRGCSCSNDGERQVNREDDEAFSAVVE
jgi:hypothetical protein